MARNDLLGRVKKNIENLIVIDPKNYIFNNQYSLDEKERELIYEKFKEIFSFLREKIREDYFFVLATYYSNLLPDKMKKDFDDEFDVDFSKQQIRERINSPLFGLRAPGAWIPLLVKRASAKEMREYLKKVFSIHNRKISEVFWLSEYFIDSSKETREEFKRIFLDYLKNNDVYSAELINSLVSNEGFLGMIEEHKKNIPNFRIRRQNLIKQLTTVSMKDYIVYELIGLGDMNIKYFDSLR